VSECWWQIYVAHGKAASVLLRVADGRPDYMYISFYGGDAMSGTDGANIQHVFSGTDGWLPPKDLIESRPKLSA